MTTSTVRRAPGITWVKPEPQRKLIGAPMDVCAFLGVAPRGPSRVPAAVDGAPELSGRSVADGVPRRRSIAVPVESFDEYERLFGGFEGPGRLPYAVAAYFDQGGRRAYVVRIVHAFGDGRDDEAVAAGVVADATTSTGDLVLRARDEGSWGNGLRAAIGFQGDPLAIDGQDGTSLFLNARLFVPAGTTLRLRLDDEDTILRTVTASRTEGAGDGREMRRRLTLDAAPPASIETCEVLEATLVIDDGDGRRERHEHLGLRAGHPRWLADVLVRESELVWPAADWVEGSVDPADLPSSPTEPALPAVEPPQFAGGEDRFGEVVPGDFMDDWLPGDPDPGDGIAALVHLGDVSTVVTPDLYSPESLPGSEEDAEDSLAGPDFEPCVTRSAPPEASFPSHALVGLRLDPAVIGERKKILEAQAVLASFVAEHREFVLLLDVPPGLDVREIQEWRSVFSSSYLAAYHPWLEVSRADDARDSQVLLNPSSAAAGIVARRELQLGIPHGPANVVVAGATDVEIEVSPSAHDRLHVDGVNVFLRERDGVRLTAARTLARDASLRQLSVRRLMLHLRRTLLREMEWVVFESNGPPLWRELRFVLNAHLRKLYRQGAFRGASENEAFFVRCDETLNPTRVVDAGQLICEVGVAPAEPLEFIVLRLARLGGELEAREVSA